MKSEVKRDFYLMNGKKIESNNIEFLDKVSAPYIYEVIRVIDGVALFSEAHIDRLRESLRSSGYELKLKNSDLISDMNRLIELNGVINQNIKIVCTGFEKEDFDIFMYFILSHYPAKEVYSTGIKTILFKSERENPNAKVMNKELRQRVNKKLQETGAFEALLVDDNGYITEGSRSNFFFIKDNGLYTPPADTVLMGITRKEVIASARELGIELKEERLKANEIDKLDGVFITGTSNDALPIRYIDDIEIMTAENDIMKSIIKKYNEKVKIYIDERK
ncbi:MAG: aminotransferase class IV [Andreesenia angusta]|nr:aminotransferase class IV [Andreesenia angusta]